MSINSLTKTHLVRIEYLSMFLKYLILKKNKISNRSAIPVLIYHKIFSKNSIYSPNNWTVSEVNFEKQIDFLYENKYKPLSIDEYLNMIKSKKYIQGKKVLITFDDGYKNFYKLAYPILMKYNFSATIFLSYNYIDTNSLFPWDKYDLTFNAASYDNLKPLSWDEIDQMSDKIDIGSHTLTHPHLANTNQSQMYAEIFDSKKMIEDKIGRELYAFSYPGGIKRYGDYSDKTRKLLIDAGYRIAFNSEIGRNNINSDPYTQKRIYVEKRDSLNLFQCKLIGAFDWMRVPQFLYQLFFSDSSNF